MGCGEVVNTTDFDSVIREFKSHQPSLESLNQLVEHLIFKMLEDRNAKKLIKMKVTQHFRMQNCMKKIIKRYMEYGKHCGIAKQVEGKVVDAELGKDNLWHFEFGGYKWVVSDYAFKE